MIIEWLISEQNQRNLYINFYKFRINRRSDVRTYWKCSTSGCRKAAVFENDVLVLFDDVLEHNHGYNLDLSMKNKLSMLCFSIIEIAPYKSAFKIYQSARKKLLDLFEWHDSCFRNIPIFENFKNIIYNKKEEYIPSHNNLNFEIPDSFKFTLKNKIFLAIDNRNKEDSIICYLEKDFVRKIFNFSDLKLMFDIKFYVSPNISKQLYVIHAFKGNKYFPLIYYFLTNKTQRIYTRLLRLLQNSFYNII
ncbi:hypothetical protein H312_02714 [Anncaliia algerae PRA339]|uniref:Uncharacterized protein n=1 Tax=Anncaliia algerae PRA339 TaxID=1288291 RepID=A0A059EYS9_9MICR|nr:hypothetical protein H312_02714 [Anncaliia algerae PRA339]